MIFCRRPEKTKLFKAYFIYIIIKLTESYGKSFDKDIICRNSFWHLISGKNNIVHKLLKNLMTEL